MRSSGEAVLSHILYITGRVPEQAYLDSMDDALRRAAPVPQWYLALEALGAGWLTLHRRTAKQGFTGTARWEYLSELKALVSLPVIASGDLFMAEDGVRCLAETGVDTVMYARGALRDPAIFKAHLDLLAGREPEVADVSTFFIIEPSGRISDSPDGSLFSKTIPFSIRKTGSVDFSWG